MTELAQGREQRVAPGRRRRVAEHPDGREAHGGVEADPEGRGQARPAAADAGERPLHEVAFVAPPSDIPPGRYVAFDDPSGNRTHVLDLSAGG